VRVIAIVLPDLALEVAAPVTAPVSARAPGAVTSRAPRGVVLASRKGMLESEITGNVRLHAVCESARAVGISPGQTLAAARATASDLVVRVVPAEALHAALERIAEAALAFGATASFARGEAGEDTVWVDVTGCAHLFIDAGEERAGEHARAPEELARGLEGEGRLLARLEARVRELGHTCRLALAGGPRVARAVASHGEPGRVVPPGPGRDREALLALPLEALPLEPAQRTTLRRLGVHDVGALARLPRAALGARLGARAGEIMQLLEGDDRAPLSPHVPRRAPSETLELEHGTDSLEALSFVVKTLASRLALRLAGRGVGVVKLTLELALDARLAGGDAVPQRKRCVLTLPTPISHPRELFVVLRARLERTLLPAPVLALTLRADECRARVHVPRSLFEPESQGSRALPLLVAELSAELGDGAVGRLTLGDSFCPDERSVLAPFFGDTPSCDEPVPSPEASPEPSLLLPEPLPVERRLVSAFRFVARHESLGWWRAPSVTALVTPSASDRVAAMVEGRAALVELDKVDGGAKILGWLD